jgi:hypothetical protein
MPYSSKNKKDFSEEFSVKEISGGNLYYYFPKIVGVSHNCNLCPRLDRKAVINSFFKEVKDTLSYLKDDNKISEFREIVSREDFSAEKYSIDSYVQLVEEDDNAYDFNAISVKVKVESEAKKFFQFSGFIDVGYLPSKHAEILRKSFPQRTVIGVEPDGFGMRLHVILSKEKQLIQEIQGNKVEEAKFLSLRKMRKHLEVKL